MLDSRTVFDPLWRATDTNGDPVSGAKLKFYLAGTSTPLTVYSDSALSTSLGTTVTCDSAGHPTSDGSTKVAVWTGTQSWKLVVTDSSDVTIATYDNMDGATDSADVGGGGAGVLETPVEAGAGDYTVVTADAGKILNRSQDFVIQTVSNQTISNAGKTSVAFSVVDGAGGASDVITLPSAVSEDDGFTVGFKHSGTGELVWLASNGANWIVTNARNPWPRSNAPYLVITDRLSQAPTSPNPGAFYIVSGTPSGSWATLGYDQHDVLEADGNGAWIEHNPQEGWFAYVLDENLHTKYEGGAWVDLDNVTSGNEAVLPHAEFQWAPADGTDGGAATTGAWTTYTLTDTVINTLTNATLSSNTIIDVPAGTYLIEAEATFNQVNTCQIRVKAATGPQYRYGTNAYSNSGSTYADAKSRVSSIITLAAADTLSIEYYAAGTGNTVGLGRATAIAGGADEVFGFLRIVSLTTIEGPQGDAGAQGAAGAGYAGTSATSIAIGNSGSKSITTQAGLAYTAGCRVKVSYASDVSKFMEGSVTAYNSGTGALDFTADYAESSGTYADWIVNLTGARGAAGATGAAGPTAVDYTGDNGTSAADPGSGKIRVNNASMASATAIYINETDRHGTSQAAWIATIDNSTSTIRGQLYIHDLTTTTQKWVFNVTGTNTDNGDYDTVNVTYVSGPAVAMPTNNVALVFIATGDAGTGAIGGSTGATDNRLLRADGTGGATLQSSAITVDDNGGITLPDILQLTGATSPPVLSGNRNNFEPGAEYTGNTTTNATGIASPQIRANNASMASATAIYVYDTDANGYDQSAWTAALSGTLYIKEVGTSNVWKFTVTGVADNTTYYTLTVTYISGPATAMPAASVILYTLPGANASVMRLSANAARNITGLQGGADGRIVTLVNVGATYTITLKDDSASSGAANRFALDSDIVLAPDTSCILIYDTTTDCWRALARPTTGKYSFYVDAASMKSTTTGAKTGATLTANLDLGSNDVGGSVLSFSASAKNHAWFRYAMPKGWDLGTLTARFFWTASTGTGTVEWEIKAVAVRDDDATGTSLGTVVTQTDALLATGDTHISAETGALTVGGTAAKPCLVLFEVARDGDAGNTDDTFSAAALLFGVEISYTRSANTDD